MSGEIDRRIEEHHELNRRLRAAGERKRASLLAFYQKIIPEVRKHLLESSATSNFDVRLEPETHHNFFYIAVYDMDPPPRVGYGKDGNTKQLLKPSRASVYNNYDRHYDPVAVNQNDLERTWDYPEGDVERLVARIIEEVTSYVINKQRYVQSELPELHRVYNPGCLAVMLLVSCMAVLATTHILGLV